METAEIKEQSPKKARWTWWRTAWLIVLVLAVAAFAYAAYRYMQYGRAKAQALLETGQTAVGELRLTDALVAFDQAIALRGVARGSAAEAAAEAAALYTAKGQHTEAQRYLRQAADLQPADVNYSFLLTKSLLLTRSLDDAEKIITEALKLNADDPGLLVVSARLKLARQDDTGARTALDQALQVDSSHAEALTFLAVLSVHESPTEAAKKLEQALSRTKDTGLQMLIQAVRPVALQISENSSSQPFDRILMSAALLEQREYDLVLLESKQAIALDETYRDAWAYRGVAELGVGDLDSASSSLARAKELDPTFGYTRYQLGLLAQMRGDQAAALEELNIALELKYDKIEVRLALVKSYLLANDIEAARTNLQQTVEQYGTESSAHETLFWLEFVEAGDPRAAAKVAKQFMTDLPTDPLGQGLAALAAQAQGDEKKARSLVDQALATDPNLAVAHLVLGLLDNDPSELTRATDLDLEGHVSALALEANKR